MPDQSHIFPVRNPLPPCLSHLDQRNKNRSIVDWRQPEEFTPSPESLRGILVIVDGGPGHENFRDMREHRSDQPLGSTVLAWAERPEAPVWTRVARTAADGERLPRQAPSGTTRETPGAAVLAGGETGHELSRLRDLLATPDEATVPRF